MTQYITQKTSPSKKTAGNPQVTKPDTTPTENLPVDSTTNPQNTQTPTVPCDNEENSLTDPNMSSQTLRKQAAFARSPSAISPVGPQTARRQQPKRTCKKDSPIELPVSPQVAQKRTSSTTQPPENSQASSSSSERQTSEKECNCQNKEKCPLDGKCNHGPMVYKAVISGGATEKVYIGCTEEYKKRLANHKSSFKNIGYKNATRLSKYVWNQDLTPNPNIKWELVKQGWPYKPGGRVCDLCLTEKMVILTEHKNNKNDLLNLRNESTDRCVHKLKFRLNRL